MQSPHSNSTEKENRAATNANESNKANRVDAENQIQPQVEQGIPHDSIECTIRL